MDADAGLRRDALADVLAALACEDCLGMTPFTRRNSPPCPTCDSNAWTVADPREAMELLHVRGLAPGDDERRGFVAMHCAEERAGKPCTCSRGSLDLVHVVCPATIPDLVAYTSLSVPTILRAEELARETVARLRPWGCPQPERVVWLVGVLPSTSEPHRIWTAGDNRALLSQQGRERVVLFTVEGDNEVPQASDVQRLGLALDSITADAITLVLPPVGSP